jgi:hypothetical protein
VVIVLTTSLVLEGLVPLVSVADVPSEVVVGAGVSSLEVVDDVVGVGAGLSVLEVVDVVSVDVVVVVVDFVLSELVVEVVSLDSVDDVVEVVEESVAVDTGRPEVTAAMSVAPWLWPAVTATRDRE